MEKAERKERQKEDGGSDRGECLLAGISIIIEFFSKIESPNLWKLGISHHDFLLCFCVLCIVNQHNPADLSDKISKDSLICIIFY